MPRPPRIFVAILVGAGVAWAAPLAARTVEPGALSVGAALGPSFRTGGLLGGSRALFSLLGTGEYAIDSNLSLAGDVALSLAGSQALRVHVGPRLRAAELDLPLSPFVELKLGYGRLFDMLGANLNAWGVRAGLGADYFLTANIAVGVTVAMDLAATTGVRPAYSGLVDALVHASFTL